MRPEKCSLAYCSHACLPVSVPYLRISLELSNLRGLSNLRADHLPLVCLVLFDGIEEGLALWVALVPRKQGSHEG